jgi:hypothetical protein
LEEKKKISSTQGDSSEVDDYLLSRRKPRFKQQLKESMHGKCFYYEKLVHIAWDYRGRVANLLEKNAFDEDKIR